MRDERSAKEYMLLLDLTEKDIEAREFDQAMEKIKEIENYGKSVPDLYFEAFALLLRGRVLRLKGDAAAAIEILKEACRITEKVGLEEINADCLNELGSANWMLGNLDATLDLQKAALEIFIRNENLKGASNSYTGLGIALAEKGEYDKGLECFHQALALYEQQGDKQGVARSLGSIGTTYERLGRLDEALEHNQKSYAMLNALGDHRNAALRKMVIANTLATQGKYTRGVKLLLEVLEVLEAQHDKYTVPYVHYNLASIYYEMGQFSSAFQHIETSHAMRKEIGDKRGESLTLSVLGFLNLDINEPEKALSYFTQSLSLMDTIATRDMFYCYVHCGTAAAFIKKKEFNNAKQALEKAEEVATLCKSEEAKLGTLRHKGLLLQAQNDLSGAKSLLRTCQERSSSSGYFTENILSRLQLAEIALLQINREEASRIAEDVLQDAKAAGLSTTFVDSLILQGLILALQMDFEEAKKQITEAVQMAEDQELPLQLNRGQEELKRVITLEKAYVSIMKTVERETMNQQALEELESRFESSVFDFIAEVRRTWSLLGM